MQECVQDFVERMGLMMEAEGLPRSAGRIFGFLLLTDDSVSLDDLAERLQVSKASVSTNARLLEQCGMLERSSAPGDRRDFYRMRHDAWERMLQVARRRWETMHEALRDGACALPPEMETAQQRLREAAEFHELLLEEADGLVERWRTRRESAAPAGAGDAR